MSFLMNETAENSSVKNICVGILAHVDAGKTTLAESILYLTGGIRKQGRVDHGDTFLDTDEMERKRGITIFSKQAIFNFANLSQAQDQEQTPGAAQSKLQRKVLGQAKSGLQVTSDLQVTLMDTPGHEDFSAEMERVLAVLDYAILVISGPDGIRAHDEMLWHLLEEYHIPVFLFINKMDQPETDREKLLEQLNAKFGGHCFDFSKGAESVQAKNVQEELAVCDEALLESYLEKGNLQRQEIAQGIRRRKIYPCYFGAALKNRGVKELLKGLEEYLIYPNYGKEFGALVYKVSRDPKGVRLTHMKVTGGILKNKQSLREGKDQQEKADQIRMYSGSGYHLVQEAHAGEVCALTGLTHTYAGQPLGAQEKRSETLLAPVLTYHVRFPETRTVYEVKRELEELEEEQPELHVGWDEKTGELSVQVMGEIALDVLQKLMKQRYGTEVEFDAGSIVYRETIASAVEGVGHFEPLRHYAEVHLLLEPLPAGSGMVVASDCPEDELEANWQNLILSNLEGVEFRGVLTGFPITDIKITLKSGKAHEKHTEGGDFRQATRRAVRQGLKSAQSILLEPVYRYRLEVPVENIGRALHDIQNMQGRFGAPKELGEMALIEGVAPVAGMRGYQTEVTQYSRGRGHLFCEAGGYEPCFHAQDVIAQIGYDSEADTENPTGSIFCSHGSGIYVPWNEVSHYMHLPSCLKEEQKKQEELAPEKKSKSSSDAIDDAELEAIFERTYGPIQRRKPGKSTKNFTAHMDIAGKRSQKNQKSPSEGDKEYLLVDGYNIIHAWDDLEEIAQDNMDGARMKLADILCNYQGFRKNILILVYDAYRVKGHQEEIIKYKNIYIVYTKEAETADQYIEKTVHDLGRKYHVTVATSDGTEQVIIMGQGARRQTARELLEDILLARKQMREESQKHTGKSGQYLIEGACEDLVDLVEDVRLGYRSLDKKKE